MRELLERETQLAVAEHRLSALTSGTGSVLVVRGPAGVGKSSFLAMVRERVPSHVLVLSTAATERSSAVPFAVAVELLSPVVEVAGLSRRTSPAAPLFGGEASAVEPASLVEGLWRATATLATSRPVVLCVDDAHWADELSARYLTQLALRLTDLAVVVLAAFRSGEGDTQLLHDLGSSPHAAHLRLAPLTPTGTARFIGRRVGQTADPTFVTACHAATGGNPFLLSELLVSAAAEGVEATAHGAVAVQKLASQTVARRIMRRVTRVGADAVAVARAVAVLGADATLAATATLVRSDEAAVLDTAAALAARGVLLAAEPLAFVHPLVASSVYADVPAEVRDRLHHRAARLLAEGGAAPEQVAVHLLDAHASRDEWVCEQLEAAAERAAARGSAELAVQCLRRVIDACDAAGARPELLLALGEAELLSGDARGRLHIEQAIVQLNDPVESARAYLKAGQVYLRLGDRGAAADAFDRGGQLAAGHDDLLTRELSAGYVFAGLLHAPLAQEANRRLTEIVASSPAHDTLGERRAMAMLALQKAAAAVDREESLALARRAAAGGELVRAETADGVSFSLLTGVFGYTGELADGFSVCTVAEEDVRRRPSLTAFATMSFCRGALWYFSGDMTRAAADLELAVRAGDSGWQLYWPSATAWYARVLLERNDLEGAQRAVDVDDDAWRDSVQYAAVLESRAMVHLAQGRARAALVDLLACGERTTPAAIENPILTAWRSLGAVAAAASGDHTLAARLRDEDLTIARRWGAPHAVAQALCAAAVTVGGTERLGLLEEAYSLVERAQPRLWALRAGVLLGATLRESDDRARARDVLRPLVDLASRRGALRLRDEALRELIAAGGRPRALPSTAAEGLTPAERRVVDLVLHGLSNRDVAEALFVSEKAIERQLQSVYRKLGVSNRRELAGVMREGVATGG